MLNIDTALRRREALEEMTYSEILALSYELLDEVARLRAALTVAPDQEPWVSPLTPDDERYEYIAGHFVLNMPSATLLVSKKEIEKLAEWFWEVGCDFGNDLLEEIGEEP